MILQSASLLYAIRPAPKPTYRYNPGMKGNPPNDTLPSKGFRKAGAAAPRRPKYVKVQNYINVPLSDIAYSNTINLSSILLPRDAL